MALDTRSKRSSVMNLSCPWRMSLPIPDGTIAQGDRQQLVYQCSAVSFAAPGGGGVIFSVFGMDLPAVFGGHVVR